MNQLGEKEINKTIKIPFNIPFNITLTKYTGLGELCCNSCFKSGAVKHGYYALRFGERSGGVSVKLCENCLYLLKDMLCKELGYDD
ncbi:MAG: hypothetical protein LBL34_01425 [Clostridiales bacterium]|nr:hypothetical protein [Clostridiales bacterium]